MLRSLCCCNRRDAGPMRGAVIIGVSLASVLVALALQLAFGPNAYAEALLYAAFPIALIAADVPSRPGPAVSRGVLAVIAIAAMYAAVLAVVRLADLI